MYNEYAGVQLKVADELKLKEFDLGDPVDIPDGIYVGHGGFVVIQTGLLIARFDTIKTSWGDEVKPDTILNDYHPLRQVIQEAIKGKKK